MSDPLRSLLIPLGEPPAFETAVARARKRVRLRQKARSAAGAASGLLVAALLVLVPTGGPSPSGSTADARGQFCGPASSGPWGMSRPDDAPLAEFCGLHEVACFDEGCG